MILFPKHFVVYVGVPTFSFEYFRRESEKYVLKSHNDEVKSCHSNFLNWSNQEQRNETKRNQLNFPAGFVLGNWSEEPKKRLENFAENVYSRKSNKWKNYRKVHYHHDLTIKISLFCCFIIPLKSAEPHRTQTGGRIGRLNHDSSIMCFYVELMKIHKTKTPSHFFLLCFSIIFNAKTVNTRLQPAVISRDSTQ